MVPLVKLSGLGDIFPVVSNKKFNFFNTGLLRYSVLYWMSCDSLYFLRNWSFHLSCQIYVVELFVVLSHSFDACKVCSDNPSSIPDISNLL